VRDAPAGLYRYEPSSHRLMLIASGDRRKALAAAAWDQDWIERAAAVFLVASVDSRTTGKYGHRGTRFVQMEAGHAAQNALLQASALGLGATLVGAFDDGAVHAIASLAAGTRPLCLIAVGHPH
jgi:SagB-type dehydrogenase family enzyme